MKLAGLTAEDDFLLHQIPESFATAVTPDPKWFERLYFNFHDPDGRVLIVTGFGVFPNAGVADAYVMAEDGTGQRNIRLARDLGGRRLATEIGPLHFEVLDPMRRWRLALETTEGIAFDVVFEARTVPYSVGLIEFKRSDGPDTAFRHYNQAGRYAGSLVIDGQEYDVDGWFGHRDHSWGLRQPRERLGLHIWLCGHFEDRTYMASYNESREHEVSFCEGAVLYADDRDPMRVVGLGHELTLADNGLQSRTARLRLHLEDDSEVELLIQPTLPDLLMSGGGHGGWHGQHRGNLHIETDRWDHTSAPDIRDVAIGVVDQMASFDTEVGKGAGIFEMGISRSPSYRYVARW